MNRTQFTFYESFFRAVSCIKKSADRAQAYDLICRYALYGDEPDTSGLPDSVAVAFEMVKPNLASSRRKATSGKKGGEGKQTGSKPEANRKRTGSKENAEAIGTPKQEKEKEQEQDKDKEQMLSPLPPLQGMGKHLQDSFSQWLSYKRERREPYKPTGLQALESQVRNNANVYGEDAVANLIQECMANGWRGIIWDRLHQGRSGKSPGMTNQSCFCASDFDDMDRMLAELEQNGM